MQSITVFYMVIAACVSKELPSFIKKCSLKEDLGKCIKSRIDDLLPRLPNGIPELKLPPIEPLLISKMELHAGGGGGVTFDASLTDMKIVGLKTAVIEDYQMDLEKKRGIVKVHIPYMTATATYKINGKVLLFELNAEGPMSINITNTYGMSNFGIDVVKKNGKEYVQLNTENTQVEANFDKATVYFEKMFENQDINNEVNKAINENIKDLSKEVTPVVHQATHAMVVGLISPVFNDHSIEELFDP